MIHLIVPGRPPRKNELHRIVTRPFPKLVLTQRANDFFDAVKVVADAVYLGPRITWGVWQCSILAAHDQRAKIDEFDDLGRLDCDAPITLVFDALQRADVIDDDVRITQETSQKIWDKENPRVEIWLEEIA